MKVRTGFVSNSSTSSFCLLGISIGSDSERYEEINTAIGKKWGYKDNPITARGGLEDYDSDHLVGAWPHKMKDNETLWEFKSRICSAMKEVGLDANPDQLEWLVDGGYC